MSELDHEEITAPVKHQAPVERSTLDPHAIEAARPAPGMVDKLVGGRHEAKGTGPALASPTDGLAASAQLLASELDRAAHTINALNRTDPDRAHMAYRTTIEAAPGAIRRLEKELHAMRGPGLMTTMAASLGAFRTGELSFTNACNAAGFDTAELSRAKADLYATMGTSEKLIQAQPISTAPDLLDLAVGKNLEASVGSMKALGSVAGANAATIEGIYFQAWAATQEASIAVQDLAKSKAKMHATLAKELANALPKALVALNDPERAQTLRTAVDIISKATR